MSNTFAILFSTALMTLATAHHCVAQQPAQESRLRAAVDTAAGDWFGTSVGVDNGVAVVSAWHDDPPLRNSGAVYVFECQTSGTWRETQKLLASNPQASGVFGFSADIDGGIIAVGAMHEDVTHSGNTIENAGAVYVFQRQNGRWKEVARLTADDPGANDQFGYNLEVDSQSQSIIVGCFGEDESVADCGSAYVFRMADGHWSQEARLVDPNAGANDRAGHDVAISGDWAIVGTYLDDHVGNQRLSNVGGALLYHRTQTGWGAPIELNGSGAKPLDRAGVAVDIDGDTIAISGWAKEPSESAVVWLFERQQNRWIEVARIDQPRAAGTHFGRHIELSDGVLAVGASLDSEFGPEAGAVYIYHRQGGWENGFTKVVPMGIDPKAHAGISVAIDKQHFVVGAERSSLFAPNGGAVSFYELNKIKNIRVPE